jgi:hypothetical protein
VLGGGVHHRTPLRVLLLVWTLAACTSSEPRSLFDHDLWQPAGPETDPLADHRPDLVDCEETEWRVEDGALEVETGACNYLALTQPARFDVAPGQLLHVVLWYSTLDAVDPAEAHAALLLGDVTAWEITVDIPSRPTVHDVEIEAPDGVSAGDPVGFHLHNHGDNAWTLLSFEIPD